MVNNCCKMIAFEQYCEHCIYRGVRMATREHICTNLESSNGNISPEDCPKWNKINSRDNFEKALDEVGKNTELEWMNQL